MEFIMNDYHRNVSDKELIEDIKKIAKKLGKDTLLIDEYHNNGGKYNYSTIRKHFGSWISALQKCNLSPDIYQIQRVGYSEQQLIDDLKRVATILKKKTFTSSEYSQFGHYSKDSFFRKFGSWNKALSIAGLTPFDHPLGGGTKNRISEYACFEEIERIWVKLGRQPTTTDIKIGESKYSLHIFERRFGTWRKALEAFVSYINGNKNIEEIEDDETKQLIIHRDNETANNEEKIHKTTRDINLRLRFLVMKRDSFKCCLCGRSPSTTQGLELHIDHIIPWSKGGETVIENLQTLCSDCNLGKSNLYENK